MDHATPPGGTAVYLRISEDKLGLALGVDRQRGECGELCTRRGWADPAEYADNDISASTGRHRPGYAALVAAIERGEVTRVVVWHPSRIWRNRAERAAGIELFKRHRVTLACVKGPELDLSTAYGRIAADLFGAFDSAEGEIKAERLQATIRQRAEQGRPAYPGAGTRLYGYELDGVTVVDREAEQVRGWFSGLLAGRSVAAMAREAGCWPTTMRDRLRNPRYAGIRMYEGREYPAVWPAIVDRATWESACHLLADPKRTTNGGTTAKKHLGSGLYRCGRCGGRVTSAYYSSRGKTRHVYRCRPDLGGCCRMWHRERVDAYVEALVRERLGRPDLADLLPKDRPDLDKLREEAKGIRGRMRRMRSDYLLFGVEDEAELGADLDRARRRLAELEAELGDATRGGVLGQLVACEDPVALWDAVPAEQVDRRQAIVRVVMTITLDAGPRGNPMQGRTWEESVAWYGDHCVSAGPPQ